MNTNYINDKNELIAKADFEASKRKISELVNFLGECRYKELIENPKTGEYFYHLLTKNGEEAIVELPYIMNCFKEHQVNRKKLGAYQIKVIDEINRAGTNISKIYSEEVKKMKSLIGNS